MNEIIKECNHLMQKYGHLPFDQALPFLQSGWEKIGLKHGLTGADVFMKYMDWKSKQTEV